MKKPALFLMIFILFTLWGMGAVYAEPTTGYQDYDDETYANEVYTETTVYYEDVTEPQYTTEMVTDPAEADTQAQQSSTAPTTEQSTNPPADDDDNGDDDYYSLPEIASEDVDIPSAIGGNLEENESDLFWGFVAWICIGVGIAVIFAVLLTTKTRAFRNSGKKRYSSGDKISGKQRLLNDKYYTNNKRR